MSHPRWPLAAHCNVTREQVYEMNEQLGESGCQVCSLPANMHPEAKKLPRESTYLKEANRYARGGAQIVQGFTRGS